MTLFTAQVSIEAPVPSIAALALHKWLQDLHQKVQTDGSACLHKRIVLSVGHFTRSPSQPPALPPARADTGPQIPPEEEEQQTGVARIDTQAGSPSAAGQAPEARTAVEEEVGPSSLALRAGANKSPQSGQKRMASALPAVAARIFGPEYDAAANQAAVLDMVRGFGLPFQAVDDSDKFALEADAEALAEWLQAGQFEAIMTGFAQPITSPLAGMSCISGHCLLLNGLKRFYNAVISLQYSPEASESVLQYPLCYASAFCKPCQVTAGQHLSYSNEGAFCWLLQSPGKQAGCPPRTLYRKLLKVNKETCTAPSSPWPADQSQ